MYKRVSIVFPIERENDIFELEISGYVEPDTAPCYGGHPDNWESGSPGSSEIDTIYYNGAPWGSLLSEEETKAVEQELFLKFEEDMDALYEAMMEEKYESLHDY